MQESIPKRKNSFNQTSNTENTKTNETLNNNINNDPFTDAPIKTEPTQKYNADIVLGKILKEVRYSGNNLLFAMLTQIKGYLINLNNFVIICDSVVNYQDLKDNKVLEILNNALQKFDYNLKIEVQLQEDNSKEIREENIRLLKETFGSLLKLKE